MGPNCYLLLQQEQHHLPEELVVGPDCYLLLQKEQHHLPEKLDTGGS